jgi:hypothetical protein
MIQYTKLAHCIFVIIIIIAVTEGECGGKRLEDLLVFSTVVSSIPPLGLNASISCFSHTYRISQWMGDI